MTRKPRERYFQLAGRPHVGMDDPKRFGLTLDEVVRLIDTGRWRGFYNYFLRKEKKEKALEALDFICPICKKKEPEIFRWKRDGSSCLSCVEDKSKREGAAHQAKSGSTKKRNTDKKQYCPTCRGWRINVIHIGQVPICQGCVNKL